MVIYTQRSRNFLLLASGIAFYPSRPIVFLLEDVNRTFEEKDTGSAWTNEHGSKDIYNYMS